MTDLVFRSIADRAVPPPTITSLEGTTGMMLLELDHLGPLSTFAAEQESLPGAGFGRGLCFDYYDLARAKTVEYLEQHGLKVVRDDSTLAAIRMLVAAAEPQDSQRYDFWAFLSEAWSQLPRWRVLGRS
jgi:hypothetical protein